VLHIIGSLRLGGAQVCLKQIVEHNEDPGIEHVIYPLRPEPVDIPIHGRIIHRPYVPYDPRKFLAILNICRDQHIDVIHAHLHKPILGALLATFFCNVKVIVHEHGPIFRRGIQYTFYRFMLRLLKSRASIFIANSQATADRLVKKSKIPKSKKHIIYNAIDIGVFQPNSERRKSVRRQFDLNEDDIVIGFVGRLHEVKGVDLLVRSIPLLLQKNPHVRLLLVGDGPLMSSLKSEVHRNETASHVCFAGFRENIHDIMNAFDIGCMPSRQEPFGIVALEMMCMKIPLVCSASEGLTEIITDNENALVPKTNTPADICECLLRLINDPTLRQSLAQRALRTAQRFDVSRLVAEVNSTYRTITQKD